nr:uncharacterized protein LOC117690400 [Crassostrea gigas]
MTLLLEIAHIQISIVYSFNFTTASNGTLLRCLAVDNTLKLNATVELFASSIATSSDCGNDTYDPVRKIRKHNRIEVFRHYRGYAWSSINIAQQNKSGSFLLLNVSSNGNVESETTRISGSVTKDDDYINVTVSFDASPGSGVCELNQTYSCDIQLIDSSIGTIAANSTLILEIPVTDVQIHLQPEYQYGLSDWINCTANTIDKYTPMFLEVCVNESTFIPLENATNSTYFELFFCRKNENCSVQKMLSNTVL